MSAGVGRRDAVALVSMNCEQLATALLAAEAVGIAAPINPARASPSATRKATVVCIFLSSFSRRAPAIATLLDPA